MQIHRHQIWKWAAAVALFTVAAIAMRAAWFSEHQPRFDAPVAAVIETNIASSIDPGEKIQTSVADEKTITWDSQPVEIVIPEVAEPIASDAVASEPIAVAPIAPELMTPESSAPESIPETPETLISSRQAGSLSHAPDAHEPAIPVTPLPKFELEDSEPRVAGEKPIASPRPATFTPNPRAAGGSATLELAPSHPNLEPSKPTQTKKISNPYFSANVADVSDSKASAPKRHAQPNDYQPATASAPTAQLSEKAGDNVRTVSASLPFPATIQPTPTPAQPTPAQPTFAQPTTLQPTPAQPAASQPPAPTPPANELGMPSALANADKFVLAPAPPAGAHWKDDRPLLDRRAVLGDTITHDFSADPIDQNLPYDAYQQMDIYEGKQLYATQRPLLELGRPWYQLGQLSPPSTRLGKHNPINHQFLVYGDVRSTLASYSQNGNGTTRTAYEVNLDFDWQITSTERFHAFMAPLDNGVTNTGYVFDDDEWTERFDANFDFGYFEGDLGAIVGGMTGQTLPFDFPFAVGVMPLVLQNGVWMEDAFLGIAATIPARNSARFNISNMDVTFFAGFDKITSDAFRTLGGFDDSAAKMYGMASFIEALDGYFEIDYAFLDDRTFADRSYHNVGFGYTRRYGRWISNSTRMIVNTGQSTDVVENSADGVLLLSENSLITGSPSSLVPYLNFFAGFDRPQSAARAAQAGGILRNTGILFETDGMTNYPTLDPTANDTFGGALGINLLANDLSQQLVVEAAMLGVMGEDLSRNAAGNQYGVGMRYQLPLTNALIFRADTMVGFLDDASDIHGARMELRHKY